MQIIQIPIEMQALAMNARRQGKRVGFVPTMGYLHEGHMALMRRARSECDLAVLSIYVNPTQFAPTEDLAKYPRDTEGDLTKARQCGIDAVFFPTNEVIYPTGYETYINLENLPNYLCGRSRPGHFRGVATIVAKLFNIVMPDRAYFGQKDYQQWKVIEKMTRDLHLPITIIGLPTVREPDGLAMSSRNNYLNATERRAALSLSRSLHAAQSTVQNGEKNLQRLKELVTSTITETALPRIDYVEICNPDTCEPLRDFRLPALLAIAAVVGPARLIDNCILG